MGSNSFKSVSEEIEDTKAYKKVIKLLENKLSRMTKELELVEEIKEMILTHGVSPSDPLIEEALKKLV